MKVKDFKKDFGSYMNLYGKRGIELYERGLITLDEVIRLAHESYITALNSLDERSEEILTNIMGERVTITEQNDGTIKALFDTGACHAYRNFTFEEVVNKYYKQGYAF